MIILFGLHLSGFNTEGNRSTTPDSIVHTEGKWKPGSASSVPETPLTSAQGSPANDSQDFTSASQIHSRKV